MESLVSLKAELQRKRLQHQEALAAGLPRHKLQLKGRGGDSNKGVDERAAKDAESLAEDRKAAEKSKSVLEQKAALYDKLQAGVAVLEDDALNNSFLINFQKKIVDNVLSEKSKRDQKSSSSAHDVGDLDDWVEHVDALGRTRQVRRRDLPELLEQDRFLSGQERGQKAEEDLATDEGVTARQEAFEEQYREKQRQRWQQQEDLNATKTSVHYQDVMFDEARTHGVGFVALSGDEATRAMQQQLLRDLHASSEAAARQHKRDARLKERGMAQRLAKIRQRKRLKQGLPMTGQSEELKTPPESDEEDKEYQEPLLPSEDVPAKRPDAPLREWDVGKQLIGKLVEPAERNLDTFNSKNALGGPVEMTQELWVDRQRSQRNNEFAPPTSYDTAGHSGNHRRNKDSKRKFNDKSGDSFRSDSLSSRLRDEDLAQRRHNCKRQGDQKEIVNECAGKFSSVGKKYETSSVFDEIIVPSVEKPQRKRAEVAPPPSLDYYAPNSRGRPQPRPEAGMQSLEEAISTGLKRIKEQT